jgi:hypothetical protein
MFFDPLLNFSSAPQKLDAPAIQRVKLMWPKGIKKTQFNSQNKSTFWGEGQGQGISQITVKFLLKLVFLHFLKSIEWSPQPFEQVGWMCCYRAQSNLEKIIFYEVLYSGCLTFLKSFTFNI